MNEKTKELLKGLGVPTQTIDDLADDTKAADLDVAVIKTSTIDNLKNRFKADPEFKGDIERGLRAGILSSKESKLLKSFDWLGLEQSEIDALPEKNKFDALIDLLGTKAQELQDKGGNSEETKEKLRKLNKELADSKQEIKKFQEETIPGIRAEVDKDREQIRKEALARKKLANEKLIIDPDFAFNSIMSTIQDNFDLKLDKSGKQLLPYEKGTDNEAYDENNQRLTFDAVWDKTIETANIRKKSNADDDETKERRRTENRDDDKKDKYSNLPGLENSRRHAEEIRKQKGTAEK